MIPVVDIETTGLDPEEDLILEVGILLVDDDLNTIDSIRRVISYSQPTTLHGVGEVVLEMHKANGLFDELASGMLLYQAEEDLIGFLKNNNALELPMCGSSIHFDRSFLKVWMKDLEKLFHYRNIDVSTIKNLCERWNPSLFEVRPTGRKLHRAIPDCEDTVEELKFYKTNFMTSF